MEMEIKPKKGKKTIKVKVKPGQSTPDVPEGYVINPDKSKGNKFVYDKVERKETPAISGQLQYREPTKEEKARMEAGTFYGKNEAQYRDEDKPSVDVKKSEFIIKKKEPKFKEQGPIYTAREKREGRIAEREASRACRRFKVGCGVGSRRTSRARY